MKESPTLTSIESARFSKKLSGKIGRAAALFVACALVLVAAVAPASAYAAEVSVSTNDELVAAVTNAQSGDTIKLGAGKYTLYNMGAQTKGKDLTFVGAGTDATEWGIGATIPDPSKFGTEYNGDYSFDGAGTITFKNMTLQSGTADYLGFIRADNTVVDGCVVNGKTFYWGYTSATFTNTTFNAPSYDYALWTYSSPTMTFDGCTFNTTGKCINVYRDYAGTAYTINFKDCTVNNEASGTFGEMFQGTKQVLNINDSSPSGQSYTINISGNNTLSGGKTLTVCSIACSRLFGFGSRASNNAGNTTVNIDGTTVFTSGKQVSHSMPDQHYTVGDDEDAYTITEGEWTTDPTTGLEVQEVTKTCKYCGWSSKVINTKTDVTNLPGDILIDGDTENAAVVEVEAGSSHNLTGALQVSAVQEQMAQLEKAFENPDGTSVSLSGIDFGFTATLTVPEGITLPADTSAETITVSGVASTYKVDSASVSEDGKTLTVKFALTDDAKAGIKTYADLKNYVDAAGDEGWIKVVVNASVDEGVAAGTQLTVTGTVGGNFSATATSQYGTQRSFSYEWNGTQWADGKDAVAADDTTIQLTVKVKAKIHRVTFKFNDGTDDKYEMVEDGKTATKPEDHTLDGYTFAGWYTDKELTTKYDFSTPVTADIVLYGGWYKDKDPQPEPDEPKKDDTKKDDTKSDTKSDTKKSDKKVLPSTGDNSVMVIASVAAAGVAMLGAGYVLRKRSQH